MKEQITIYYDKDRYSKDDYIVKRVLSSENGYYSIFSYYMENGKVRIYPSNLVLTGESVNRYVLECMKATFFNRIEYKKCNGGNLNE